MDENGTLNTTLFCPKILLWRDTRRELLTLIMKLILSKINLKCHKESPEIFTPVISWQFLDHFSSPWTFITKRSSMMMSAGGQRVARWRSARRMLSGPARDENTRARINPRAQTQAEIHCQIIAFWTSDYLTIFRGPLNTCSTLSRNCLGEH